MVQNKFSSDDPYVLGQIALTARSRVRTDLTVITIENDQVKATNAFLNTQSLGNNPANPVSAVTIVGQQAIGGALGGGDIGGGGGYCFLGTTRIETLTGWKYIHGIQVKDMVVTFDPETGERSHGMVTDKFEHLVQSYDLIEFEDGRTTGTTANHKYWVRNGYRPISELDYVWHWVGEWVRRRIVKRYTILEEVILYNLTVSGFHNYIANGDAVSNRKDEPPGGFLDIPPFL